MAKTFTDEDGRDWNVKVSTLSLDRVESELSVSFSSEPGDRGGPIIRIATDCMFAFRVLWILCEKQATERGMSDEDFSEVLVGDTLGKAQKALCHAIAEFYPDPARREAAARVFDFIHAAEKKIIAKAGEQLGSINIDDLVGEVMNGG